MSVQKQHEITLESIVTMGENLRDMINSALPKTHYEPAREALKLALVYLSTRNIELDLERQEKRRAHAARMARYRAKRKSELG